MTVFCCSEVYFNSGARLDAHRVFVGVIKEINRQFTGELFYLRQNDGRSRPGDLHVIGTALRIRL